MRDYVGDIEAAVAAAARDVLDRGLAANSPTESGTKLHPHSHSACSLEVAEVYGFRGPDRRPDAIGLFLGENGWLYPEWHFAYPDDDALSDERWLEFLAGFVAKYVPPMLEGRVEREEIVRRADGKLLQTRAHFDLSEGVETYIGFNEWGGLLRRKTRTRSRCGPYAP